MTSRRALLLIDFINELLDDRGLLAGKGYARFAREQGTLPRVADLQRRFRAEGHLVIHVMLGFSPGYPEHPPDSLLLGRARASGAFRRGNVGTQFVPALGALAPDVLLTKTRVSAFFGTPLELILRTQGVTQLFIAGVATDLAVEAAVRDAHDRDFRTAVIADGCAAATAEDHRNSLRTMGKIAAVVNAADLDHGGSNAGGVDPRPSEDGSAARAPWTARERQDYELQNDAMTNEGGTPADAHR